ncbi:MAG: CPBP family intramembrane metalloprotease [Bacteroidetes bacterium]|nr:CPBP family intramembrane metalloprotease [Bacteroidota bacterium]
MKKIIDKIGPSNSPILFTVVSIFVIGIISEIIRRSIGLSFEYRFVFCAVLTILLAFSFGMPEKMRLTTKFRWNSLKYYAFPILYMMTMPLIQGGYDFSFIDKGIIIMMSGVGVFEEILTHGICMALLLNKWGENKKYKAAIVSSFWFGIIHLNNILADPTNFHLILNKCTTVIFATCIGIGFAGLAYKSNSIWLVAVMHAFMDIVGNVGSLDFYTNVYQNWGWVQSIEYILYYLPFGLYGLWLLRSTKVRTSLVGNQADQMDSVQQIQLPT